jgi:5'(3')-deoxyribonucleotidase
MMKTINFDMDGTLANFYGVEGWLDDLENYRSRPYAIAKPLVNMSALARVLNRLQREGWTVNIISWLSKTGTPDYNAEVTNVKQKWLTKHLPSVKFDNIYIVPYGTPKHNISSGILFDDEIGNREKWNGQAFDVDNILGILKAL